MDLSPEEMLRLLLTWLGASLPAFVLACWGTWDIAWDTISAHRVWGPERGRLLWHAYSNLFLSVTFLLEATLYAGIGVMVVSGAGRVHLEGQGAYLVLVPPLLLIARLVARRLNRTVQRWPLRHPRTEHPQTSRPRASGTMGS